MRRSFAHNENLFDTDRGRALLAAEVEQASAIATNVFGYQALELSPVVAKQSLLSGAQVINHHHLLCRSDRVVKPIRAECNQLPFCNETIQLMAIRHLPHQISDWLTLLSETERILAAGGVVVICCLSSQTLRRSGLAQRGWQPLTLSQAHQQVVQQGLTPIMVRPVFGESVVQRGLALVDERKVVSARILARMAAGYLMVAKKHRSQASIRRARKRLLNPNLGAAASNTVSFEK